jgi:polar amino acid transport system substrate-binding protein
LAWSWKLIVQGLGVTLLIAVLSGALGAQLGYLLVVLRRRGSAHLSRAIDAFEALMGGLPTVVVLMVLYYVIFGSLDISSILVSILAFTLIFGASAEAIMWNAIQAIDAGQSEAARSLGFGEGDTFRSVVLPQAARQFLPNLRGQFVSLIKDTSIVGYIAVEDLTRAADIIRSRTLEAFFPLLTSAAIYFAICRIAARIATLYIQSTGPKKESRTIKGVEL